MILGLRAAATALKISHVALLRAEKSGRVKRTANGKFDVDECRTALERNTNPKKSASAKKQQRKTGIPEPAVHDSKQNQAHDNEPKHEPEADLSYSEVVRKRELVKLHRERLALEKIRGEVVGLAEINAFVAGQIIKARDELTRIPGELRDQLALESDPIKIEAILTERVRQALENLAEYRTR